MTRPDCYLTDSLPQGFETDFRAWVTYDNMAARAHTPEQEAALQDYAQRVLIHGPLTKDNLDAFLDFYRCGAEESEREKRSAEAFREMPRGFDFAVDGPLIWAAFLQTYGIDLRTAQLLQSMTQFFRLWKRIEDAHLSGGEPDYALYDGKFVRTLSLPPDHDYTSEEIARAISDYVQLFDRLMKAYLAGKYTPPEIEALYCAQQQRAAILI